MRRAGPNTSRSVHVPTGVAHSISSSTKPSAAAAAPPSSASAAGQDLTLSPRIVVTPPMQPAVTSSNVASSFTANTVPELAPFVAGYVDASAAAAAEHCTMINEDAEQGAFLRPPTPERVPPRDSMPGTPHEEEYSSPVQASTGLMRQNYHEQNDTTHGMQPGQTFHAVMPASINKRILAVSGKQDFYST